MLAITGMLFATSCGNDDNNDVSLVLSEKSVEFDTAAGEKSVTVTTEAEEWSAIGSAEWINVAVAKGNLKITVKANETVNERSGKVLVIAGNANATIEVSQKGLEGNAEVTPSEVVIPDAKGVIVVDVNANSKKWTAVSDNEWLKVTAKPHKSEMVFTYEKNTGTEERTAVVTISIDGGGEALVDVKQLGREVFFVPYLDLKNATVKDIDAYETSVVLHKENVSEATENTLLFDARGQILIDVTYIFTDETLSKVQSAIVRVGGGNEIYDKFLKETDKKFTEAFDGFMAEKGFKKENRGNYINTDVGVSMEVKEQSIYGYVLGVDLIFKPIVEQDKEYPTFKKFPYLFTEWGSKKDKIDAYEADKGGVYNEENSRIGGVDNQGNPNKNDFLWYDIPEENKGEAKEYIRAYFVDRDDQPKPGLAESLEVSKNTELAFYMANGEPVLTKEFKELCEKEGFEYLGKLEGGFHRFDKAAKGVVFIIRQFTFQGEETPSLQYHMFRAPEGAGASVKVLPTHLDIKSLDELVK